MKSFPPADDLLSIILKIDWNKVFQFSVNSINQFLDIVEVVLVYIVAIVTVLINKMKMKKYATKYATIVYVWVRDVIIPLCIRTWAWVRVIGYPQAHKNVKQCYNWVRVIGYPQAQKIVKQCYNWVRDNFISVRNIWEMINTISF